MHIAAALEELSQMPGLRFSVAHSDRDAHAQSETYFDPCPPEAVIWPQNTQQVSDILQICHRLGCPVVAWGAGTSLEGNALARHGGVMLDFRDMDQVLAVHAEDMDVVVQPGILRQTLNEELRATGLFFPVDPGANASLGGMASTRASGTTTVRYGSMAENVKALEVVLADGRIIRTGSRAAKSAAGLDLTRLMLGAEGTLGLITELTLKLHGQPEAVAAATCSFDALEDAVNAVITTIQSGIPMARIEFVDAATTRAFNAWAGVELPEKPHLMVEFHGSDQAVAEQSQRFGDIVADFNGADFKWAVKTEERSALWAMRHNAYYACLALQKGASALVTDICVPISNRAQAVEETQRDIAASDLNGPILGHVGDGNFHAILLIDPERPETLQVAKDLAGRMAERALRLGGTITGEHGIGMGKTGYMEAEHGAGWDVMGQIKTALDPKDILNPGKLYRGTEAG